MKFTWRTYYRAHKRSFDLELFFFQPRSFNYVKWKRQMRVTTLIRRRACREGKIVTVFP